VPRSAAGAPSQGPQPKPTHPIRVVVYVRTATTSKKVLDVAGDAFHAAVGHFEGDELVAHHSSGGDPEILEMLAEIVSDNPTGEAGRR
jgi:hypothetical protein